MHVIQTVGSLAPETGGPARSVPNLALALAKEGIEVTILSLDLGRNYSSPLIPSHPLLKTVIVPSRITAGMRTFWIPDFRNALRSFYREDNDLLIHDHGIWLPQNGITVEMAKQFDIPLVISPRGMLQPWAMKFHRWRKLIAWYLYQRERLRSASLLHATSLSESMSIRDLGLENPVCVIPNGTIVPDMVPEIKKGGGLKKRILFLSRIHPNKGLLNLVNAVSRIDLKDWELVIAGYDENNHQQEVESAVIKAGLSKKIKLYGPVEDEEKWDLYRQSDIFILPSLSENFGIVVAEALACGLPVIATTPTPWEELERYNCGWWINPAVEDMANALQEAINLPERTRKEMGIRGRKLVEEKYSWNGIAKEMIKVYRFLIEDRLPPDTISFS